ncbi:MAG: BREX-1 system phosphatase PglZ type A [Ferruginibacter sp.]
MELENKIKQQFTKYPQIRILFFFDPEKESEEEINRLSLTDIKVVKYANIPFNLKFKLNNEWAADKIFLYFTSAAPSKQEEFRKFPLMDVLVANKELRLGDVSDFMEQYQLKIQQYALVAKYIHELKYPLIQDVIKPYLNAEAFTEENIQRGLISAFLKFSEPQTWNILLTKLFVWANPTHTTDFIKAEKKLKENRLDTVLINRINDLVDEKVSSLNQSILIEVLIKIKYNLIVQNIELVKHDPYGVLKIKHNVSADRLGIFFEQIRSQPKLGAALIDNLLLQGKEIKESVILQYYGANASYGWMPDTLKWLVLVEYMSFLPEDTEKALSGLERMGMHHEENAEIRSVLNACQHSAICLQLIASINTYRLNKPEEYIKKYTEEYYRIDQYYRKAIYRLEDLDHSEIPAFVASEKLRNDLNNQYNTWLERFNREWLACLQTKQFNYAYIGVPKQYDFYKNEVAAFDQKLVVFISDALRYEAGMELLNEMHNDRKSEAIIKFMLASIPSKTSVGMSNLLPGNKRDFNNDDIRIDGMSSQSLVNRQAILQATNDKAITVSYEQVEQNSQEQNRELFKAAVVYIYHNHIDAVGDDRKSERRTFKAVEDSLVEIKRMVKKIHSTYNVARILITADHGFLYNDQTIAEADKEDPLADEPIIQHNRFGIFDKAVIPALGYSVPLNATTLFKDDRWIVIPASTNRYKRQGSGQQYVHGGASLQELIVPVIESARRREDITKKVNVKLLTTDPKIISNTLRVEILQENNVSRYEKGRIVRIGIYKDYELVSTEQEIAIDSASEFASERLFNINLSITKSGLVQSTLTLKVFDTEDTLNPLIEKTVINNTLIQKDF